MAMNIISKEKKEIRWLGLPTNSVQEANALELDKKRRVERIRTKTQQLQELILQVKRGLYNNKINHTLILFYFLPYLI